MDGRRSIAWQPALIASTLVWMESRDRGKRLHARIERRRGELEAVRTRLAADVTPAGCERARAVDDALSVLTTRTGSEWKATVQVEALHLASWLDSTEHLVEAADLA
jgi:hypothetical protein